MSHGLTSAASQVAENDAGGDHIDSPERLDTLAGELQSEPGHAVVFSRIGRIPGEPESSSARAELPALAAARRLDDLCSGLLAGSGYNPLDALVDDLRSFGDALPAPAPGEHERRDPGKETGTMKNRSRPVLFFGEEHIVGEYIRWFRNSGANTSHTDNIAKLPQVIRKLDPVALIVDLSGEGSELDCLDQLAPVTADLDHAEIRIIFISERADQEVRLRAAEAGGDAFLIRPLTPQTLLQQLDPLLMSSGDLRVLVAGERSPEDDSLVESLQHNGMIVRTLENNSQLLLSAINFSPDLLMLTCTSEGRDCSVVSKMIHQLPDFEDLPVICLGKPPEKAQTGGDAPTEWIDISATSTGRILEKTCQLVASARVRRARMLQLQTCDQLTGLLSREGFFSLLGRGVTIPGHVGLVLVEIENIEHGYPELLPDAVSELLAKISGLLVRFAASADVAARVSDYTFAFLVSRETRNEISKLGQFMSHSLSSRIFDARDCSLALGCSVGVAVSAGGSDNGLALYSLALKACQEARFAGINRVSIRSLNAARENRATDTDRKVLELLKLPALFERFNLVFQPIASLRGNSIEKYEVLLRMKDEEGEPVPPSCFVPLADRQGLMPGIDRWVVEQVIMRLQARENEARFFVKVASGTLQDEEFVAFVRECLEKYGVSAGNLVFEISKSNVASGIRRASVFSGRVTALGCSVSLDHSDFTQDISALFEHIPASFVKLDSNAVTEICSDPEKQQQLRSMIEVSEGQDARIIAGYIETSHCLQLLWQCGVHYIQGNFLQEPNELLDFDFGTESS